MARAAAGGPVPGVRGVHLLRRPPRDVHPGALLLRHQLQHPQPPLRRLLLHPAHLQLPQLPPLAGSSSRLADGDQETDGFMVRDSVCLRSQQIGSGASSIYTLLHCSHSMTRKVASVVMVGVRSAFLCDLLVQT